MTKIFYTDQHEWIRLENGEAYIGITEYAQEQLGDIVFVELPEIGKVLLKGDEAAVVESVKAASEVYMPVGGEVLAVNEALDARSGAGQPRGDEGGLVREAQNRR